VGKRNRAHLENMFPLIIHTLPSLLYPTLLLHVLSLLSISTLPRSLRGKEKGKGIHTVFLAPSRFCVKSFTIESCCLNKLAKS